MHSPCGGHVHVEHDAMRGLRKYALTNLRILAKAGCIIRAVKFGTGLQHLEGNRTERELRLSGDQKSRSESLIWGMPGCAQG